MVQDSIVTPLGVEVSRAPLSRDELARRVSNLDAVKKRTSYTDFAAGFELIHNGVHDWVGGTMELLETAAADPLSWVHHAIW